MTVQRMPRFTSASTACMPMNPAPMITASPSGRTAARMPRASCIVHRLNTPGRSRPWIGGRQGEAPVAISSAS